MVRVMIAAALMAAASGAAQAQGVNWRAAGGDLFGGAPALEVEEAQARDGEPFPMLGPLDQPFQEAVAVAAAAHGLDPKLLHALVVTESAYRPDAVSPVGAAGLTQLMPATALELGVSNRFDPVENLRGGADYLARQILRFGDLRLALAAYPREVVRRALELSASAMILVHNHPSGDPTPSRADIDMTRRIIDAARVFDIQVHDHVIVGREGTKSFRALGLM